MYEYELLAKTNEDMALTNAYKEYISLVEPKIAPISSLIPKELSQDKFFNKFNKRFGSFI